MKIKRKEKDMGVLEAVLNVMSGISTWFVETIPTIISIFYAENALTFMGVLAVAGLAISVIFLLMGVIQNFLHFRG